MYWKRQKEPWQIIAARFCVEGGESGFDWQGLKDHLAYEGYKIRDGFFDKFFDEEIRIPAGRDIRLKRQATSDGKWITPPELIAKMTDFTELKAAKENAKWAFWLSIVAIIISIAMSILQIMIIQDVRVKSVEESILLQFKNMTIKSQ